MLVLLVWPVVICRGFVRLLADVALRARAPAEVEVVDSALVLHAGGRSRRLPLAAVVQVYRVAEAWTVLFADHTAVTIPAAAITPGQLDHLRALAWRPPPPAPA